MRYIRYAFWAVLAIVLVTLALANRQMVTLNTLPEGLASMLNALPFGGNLSFSIDMPLFLVIFIGIALGLLIGFVFEYLREMKIRGEASRSKSEVRRLERELKRTKAERDKDKDEVLAILDEAS